MITMVGCIPQELRDIPRWVGAYADSKIPIQLKNGNRASSTNMDTWSECMPSAPVDYLGFVFADDGYVGIDIDCGFDSDGIPSATACDIIRACTSYTEISRSGRGYHIITRADLPFKGRNNQKGVEIYKTARYFIMTGYTVLFDTIIDNQDAVDYVVSKYFSDSTVSDGTQPTYYTPDWSGAVSAEGRISLHPRYPVIGEGSRNVCMTSLAGSLHHVGFGFDKMLDEVLKANRIACIPPLPRGEIVTICNSVSRYERRKE